MIPRSAEYYTTGYDGMDANKAPFYLRALVFDGASGDLNAGLIDEFNEFLKNRENLSRYRLLTDGISSECLPSKVIVINASGDNLPTSYETARIFRNVCKENKYPISEIVVVNTHDELITELAGDHKETLIMSQCVDKTVYNIKIAEELEKLGTTIVPGKITAPGSIFSDKDSTYKLLSGQGKIWRSVAKYRKIDVREKDVSGVVTDIFKAIGHLEKETGDSTFFIKPHEGGGGLGGFRITRMGQDYLIPDLSKVTGDASEVHPTFIDFDVNNVRKLRELLWIYKLFSKDEKMSRNYIKIDLPIKELTGEAESLEILREYLEKSKDKRQDKLAEMRMSEKEAHKKLTEAINLFEAKFKRRYVPLVNEHIDFGLWGLRAHYRLSVNGPRLEAMYHRIFQLGFTEEGLGYMGSDNISNKQTGDLEITRLGPVNEIMLDAIGGRKALFATLLEGAEALAMLMDVMNKKERERVPLRIQLDLATISQKIGEGNADTARGLCLASRWSEFVSNAEEWFKDSLSYYAWKKND